jgi:hypothetical protein
MRSLDGNKVLRAPKLTAVGRQYEHELQYFRTVELKQGDRSAAALPYKIVNTGSTNGSRLRQQASGRTFMQHRCRLPRGSARINGLRL